MSNKTKDSGYEIYSGCTQEEKDFYNGLNPGGLQVEIDLQFSRMPKDKRSKEYKIWKQRINDLMEDYHRKSGIDAYHRL